jgi:U4/U6 small nuclear ribonucleoprotein PRP3
MYELIIRVKYLSNGRHKFKVRETAKKDHLSGVCIFNPNFALVLVEGVDKGIKHYKQLLLNRIDWTEQARPLAEGEGEGDEEGDGAAAVETQDGDADMAENKCELIWEGEVPERSFKQFRARHSESDTGAKNWLTPKYEGMWDLAKRYVWSGEDL